ncbi:MAG: flotillin family protein [Velocimicrobium sp.]
MGFLSSNVGVIGVVAFVIILLGIIASGYVKAPPDQAFIISGIKKKPRVLIGKAGIKIPFLERKDILMLGLVQCDVKTPQSVPTNEFINIFVDAVANVKIGSDEISLAKASENFLGRSKEYIMEIAQQVLEGNMREIVGQMRLEELVQERDKFAEKVKQNANRDMQEMGLQIVNLTIQNFSDENNVIDNLGVDNVVRISKEAAISRANSEKEIAVAQAVADKTKNEAEVASRTSIAERENELLIKQASLKKESDVKKAEADAAYEIQKQEQRKTIEIATSDADIAKQDKAITLKQKEAEVKEKELESTIKKQAEADRFAAQQNADAELYKRQREADAKKYELQQEAEAKKIQAEADLFAKKQEAEGIRQVGLANAESTKANLIAEAEGIEKKAEAQTKMGQASVLEMYFNAMPEIAKNIAEPLTKVDKITMYGEGNTAKMVGDITQTLTKVMSGLQDSTGIDVSSLLGGYFAGTVAKKTVDQKTADQKTINTNYTEGQNAKDNIE